MIGVPIAIAVVAAYFGIRLVVTRPRPVKAAAPTPELGDEPPAVVNLLVHRMVDAPQVASATLLDLAVRHVVELHEVADDPAHTLVHRRSAPAQPLSPYEQRVLDRLDRVGQGRPTPVAALASRYAEGGEVWQRRLARDAVLEARRLGLIRASRAGAYLLALVAAGIAMAALLAPLVPRPDSDRFVARVMLLAGPWLVLTLIAALLLSATRVREAPSRPDRYTAKGRRVTAHWLGVRAWLRAHEPLRDLPPAAVAVWDRYLAYGVALDVMPHAVRVLDLETVGHRDELWSTHTGQRRMVKVTYPARNRVLRPAGPVAAGARLVWAILTLPVWLALVAIAATTVSSTYPRLMLVALFAVQAARAAYRMVRACVDLARPAVVTGTVLDITIAGRQHTSDDSVGLDLPDLPTHYWVVVDDASTDVLRPWIVNRDVAGADRPHLNPLELATLDPADRAAWLARMVAPSFQPGDRVRLVGQRWSRYVRSIEPLPRPQPSLLDRH